MSTTGHTEACTQFAETLLGTHHPIARSPDDPVLRCACGRAAVMCEVNSAARDAGLITPLTGPRPPSGPGSAGSPKGGS